MTEQCTRLARDARVDARMVENPWLGLGRGDRFYEDAAIRDTLDRALSYVRAGVCVNLSGAAGLGKTSLALRIAEELGRPISFMTGNEWLTASDFIGREVGQSTSTVVDKYIQSVRRSEIQTRADWKDAILAVSMQRGSTLVYDEFTRASPKANSPLLSVLEEGVLVATDQASLRPYVEAHPDFRIILTSNPHDYVGVNGAPDALVDRMVTLRLGAPPRATLAGIVAIRSGLDRGTERRIVDLVEGIRQDAESRSLSSMRASILIARIAALRLVEGGFDDAELAIIASDVLCGRSDDVSAGRIADVLAGLGDTTREPVT